MVTILDDDFSLELFKGNSTLVPRPVSDAGPAEHDGERSVNFAGLGG